MKILTIADLHFQGNSNIQFFQLFITKLEKILCETKYDYVVQLGDVRHKFKIDDRSTLTLVCQLFTMITKYCPLIVLVGNHDMDDSLQFLTENHTLIPFYKWPNITIVDVPYKLQVDNKTLIFCPYVPKGRLHEALNEIEDWQSADVVFVHQEMMGVKMGAIVSIDGDTWSTEYPMLISGHIHNRQQIENIVYPGMPYDIGFDESEKRYVLDITLGDSVKLKYINTNMPRKIIKQLTYEEAKEWEIPDETNYYKLKIVSTTSEFTNIVKTRKDLKGKNIKIMHISCDEKRIEEFLQEKKESGGGGSYKEQLQNLVKKEKKIVQKLYKKILS